MLTKFKNSVTHLTIAMMLLSGCASESVPVAESVSTNDAVSIFERTCLTGLPNFSNFAVSAVGLGLEKTRLSGLDQVHWLPSKRLFVGLAESPSGRTCVIAFDSDDNAQQLGEAFLSAATKKTRTRIKKRYPSSFFEYAAQLSNGSLMTHDLRTKSGADRSIIIVTGPLTEEEIKTLIYN